MQPLRGNLGPLTLASKAPVLSWWLAGGVSAANCVAAYAPKGAASLAASYTNLANPGTYNAAPGVAPTWSATDGWIFDGATHHLLTGIIPTSGWTMIVRILDGTTGGVATRCPIGQYTGGTTRLHLYSEAGDATVGYGNGGVIFKAPAIATGVIGVAGQVGYRNGAIDTTAIGAWSGSATNQINIGRRGRAGTSGESYYAGKVLAAAIYNVTLVLAQMQALTTAMNLI